MKVLVVYDTVSEAKVTGQVADLVVSVLKESGTAVDSYFVGDAGNTSVKDYDYLIVGAPTHAWRPSKRMKEYLAGLKGIDYSGKLAATFDTQFESGMAGNANKHMEKSLAALGFKIAAPSLISYVDNSKPPKLKVGEDEKAMAWGRDLVKTFPQ